jgi:hypothetical protein
MTLTFGGEVRAMATGTGRWESVPTFAKKKLLARLPFGNCIHLIVWLDADHQAGCLTDDGIGR